MVLKDRFVRTKPHEPTKHQYDFDSAACLSIYTKAGLKMKLNLILKQTMQPYRGHNYEHEIAYAIANNALGSLDITEVIH